MTIRPTQVKTRTFALDICEVIRAGDRIIARCSHADKLSMNLSASRASRYRRQLEFRFVCRRRSYRFGNRALSQRRAMKIFKRSNFEAAWPLALALFGKESHYTSPVFQVSLPSTHARPRVLTPACTWCHLSAKTGARWSERREIVSSPGFPRFFPLRDRKKEPIASLRVFSR